jgi:hypothetical protein
MSSSYVLEKELLSPEDASTSIEPALKPMPREAGETREFRIIDMTWFGFADHQGFEKRLDLAGVVNSRSRVFVSISEVGVFGGQWKPFQGAASCEVHNVVPHDDGIVIVRGFIGFDRDINVRLSVMVA